MGVPRGGHGLKHPVGQHEDGHIEGTAPQIVHQSRNVVAAVEAEGDGGCCGLVNDTHHVQAGDGSRGLGSGALVVVKIGWHGHYSVSHRLSEVGLRHSFHFFQHSSGDFLRGKLLRLAPRLHLQHRAPCLVHHLEREVLHVPLYCPVLEPPTNQPLDVVESVRWVFQPQVLGRFPDQALSIRGVGDHGRGDSGPLLIGNHLHPIPFHNSDTGICGAQIDAHHRAVDLLVLGGILRPHQRCVEKW
mmetsp:Transcript_36500/g.83513  ORF Transcript_36500/g.83513 Transcript_36500/m.83513 type:complete len:244 (-) Transcript_36500:48-779(-)